MKKLTLAFAALSLIGFTSCEKCTDCTCTYTQSYEFEDGFDQADEDAIRTQYDASGQSTYPAKTEEICSKRSEHDADVSTFESQSDTFVDDGTRGGKEWAVSGTYTCSCDK